MAPVTLAWVLLVLVAALNYRIIMKYKQLIRNLA